MALPKNNTSGVPTTDYAGPGAGVKIMQSDDPIAAAKAANEAYKAANPTGMDSNISPTYYTPTMQGEEGRGELRSLLSQYYDPSMQGVGSRGELQSLLAQLLQGYGMPSDQRGEISPLIRNLLISGGNTAFSPSQRARASAQRQQQEAASFLPIRSMAGGGTIDKPTMAVVGEAGPELSLLQPGDAILPLSMPQANQLLKAGTPGYQDGLTPSQKFLQSQAQKKDAPFPSFSGLMVDPEKAARANLLAYQKTQQPDVLQSFMPGTATTTIANPFQTGGDTRTVPSYVPPGPGFRQTLAPGLAGGPSALVPPKKEPTEPLPPFQWADGAGINSAELLKASRAGQYTPAMAAEVLETLSDVTADVQELESELAQLEADEDIELNDPRIIQKRQDLNDARRVFAEVQQVYQTASANQENFLSRQITETQFGREADIRERERQEDYERQLAATELQYGRSQEEDAEILARQSAQNEAVANLLTQLFGSIGITIPEEAKGALTTQNLSSLLGTFMNLQQQQQATPQVARLGFA